MFVTPFVAIQERIQMFGLYICLQSVSQRLASLATGSRLRAQTNVPAVSNGKRVLYIESTTSERTRGPIASSPHTRTHAKVLQNLKKIDSKVHTSSDTEEHDSRTTMRERNLTTRIEGRTYYYDSSSGTYGEDCASDRDNNNSNNFYQYRWLAEYKSITSDSDDDEENNLVDYPVATVPKVKADKSNNNHNFPTITMSRKYSERIRKDTPPICSSNIEQQNCSTWERKGKETKQNWEQKRGLVKEHDTIHARKRCNQYGHHRNGDGDDHTGKPDRAGAVEADGGGNILDNRRDAAATAEEDDKDSLEVVAWSHGRSCGLGLDKARLDATLFCGDGFGAWLDQMVRDLAHRDEPSLSVRPRRLAKD
nr:hypothetical protein Iba_chr01eCG9340 [Ipomoea batatas]